MDEEIKEWFAARKGSTLHWFPKDAPLGMLELNPEHEPILHWIGGASEILKLSPSGACIIDVPNPNCTITISVGTDADRVDGAMTFVEIET